MPAAFRSVVMTALGAILVAAPNGLRAQVSLLTSSVAEKEASVGETYMGRIIIANPTGSAQTLRIYQLDSAMSRSNAKWVVPQTQQIVVAPRSEATVPYTVRVPPDDSLR